jgi:hypothetical protein
VISIVGPTWTEKPASGAGSAQTIKWRAKKVVEARIERGNEVFMAVK